METNRQFNRKLGLFKTVLEDGAKHSSGEVNSPAGYLRGMAAKAWFVKRHLVKSVRGFMVSKPEVELA